MEYARQIAIFKCRLVKDTEPFKITSGQVLVEYFSGPRNYDVFAQKTYVNVVGFGGEMGGNSTIQLPANEWFISLTARSKEVTTESVTQMNTAIDSVIAQISVLHCPQMFMEPVFKGPLIGKKYVASMFARPAEPERIYPAKLKNSLSRIGAHFNQKPEAQRKFDLMSRFLSKALQYEPSEEHFMMLWTALEIYPMTDTSNIKPIAEMLARVSGEQKAEIEDLFQIGRLYGIRCDLVHDGQLPKELYRSTLKKLELIVLEGLRELAGQDYGNGVDKLRKSLQNEKSGASK